MRADIASVVVQAVLVQAYAVPQMSPRSGDPLNDMNKWCFPPSLSTEESAYKFWDEEIGGSWLLNSWAKISQHGPKDWLMGDGGYERGLYSVSKTAFDSCTVLGGTCKATKNWDCPQYFAEAEKPENSNDLKPAYWQFRALEGVYTVFNHYYTELHAKVTELSGRIDEIILTIGGKPETDDDMVAWVAAAFNMLGGGFGPIPGAGASFTMIGEILSLVEKEEDEPVNGKISAELSKAFAQTKHGLEKTLRAVFGASTIDDDYTNLPAPRNDNYDFPIAKFLNTGIWLAHLHTSGITDHVQDAVKNIERKVAHQALVHAYYVLVLNEHRPSEQECYDGVIGREWIEWENKFYCVNLQQWDQRVSLYREPLPEFHTGVMAQYGLDNRAAYYRSIMDCGFNAEGDHNLDLSSEGPGKVPRCYFPMAMVRIVKEEQCGTRGTCHHNVEAVEGVPFEYDFIGYDP